jgi:Bacterial PH domain
VGAWAGKPYVFHGIHVCPALICNADGRAPQLRAWFRRWTTEIAVTDRRVIIKHGFIRRATMEMNLQKIESVDVDPFAQAKRHCF